MKTPEPHSRGQAEILIVEDSPTQAELLRSILEKHGYGVTVARDGQEALDLLHQHAPTLIISDITMPGMDGYELCHRIRADEQFSKIPVILLTALSDPKDVLKGLECGADNFITKPYIPKQLVSRVQNICTGLELRQNERMQVGVELSFGGKRHFITSERQQILNLLLATYEAAVQLNQQLRQAQEELRLANQELEERVAAQTAALRQELAERKQAERHLQESERRYRELFEINPHPMWVYDRETLQFLAVNEAAIRHYGYSREEFLGMTLKDIRPVSDIPSLIEDVTQTPAGLDRGVWKHRTKGGSLIDAEISSHELVYGGRLARLVHAHDITERKRAEDRLREQAKLLDKAKDSIFVADIEGRVTYWNRSAELLYGWSASEALGGKLFELFPESEEAPGIKRAVEHALAAKSWTGEIKQTTKGGQELLMECRVTLVHDSEGRPQSILCILTDVTEKRRLESQFLRAQRLESIGSLASGIAHDLNNALSPILMVSELLKDEVGTQMGLNMLETVRTSAQRGAEMVQQILAFGRGAEGTRKKLEVKALIEDVAKLAKMTFPRSIRVSTETSPDLLPVFGDSTALHQVLLNLCVNARDAMPKGGVLKIEARNTWLRQKRTRMQPEPVSGAFILLTVRDAGTGIPPHLQEKIFEPFFTTKGPSKGTGLGLPMVARIVREHGGHIDLKSEPGQGSSFTVYLPALAAGLEPGAPKPSSLPGKGERILLVDDEAAVLRIARTLLEACDYKVIEAGNGADALRAFRENQDGIRAVITDMFMPIMDGAQLIQEVRRLNPAIKVICMTGAGTQGQLAGIEALKPDAVLEKPYPSEALLKTIAEVLGRPSAPAAAAP